MMTSKREGSKKMLRMPDAGRSSHSSSISSPSGTSSGYCSGTDDDNAFSPCSSGRSKDCWLPGADSKAGIKDDAKSNTSGYIFAPPSWITAESPSANDDDTLVLFQSAHGECSLQALDEFLYGNVGPSVPDFSDELLSDRCASFALADPEEADYSDVWKDSVHEEDKMTSLLTGPETTCFMQQDSPETWDMLIDKNETGDEWNETDADGLANYLPSVVNDDVTLSNYVFSSTQNDYFQIEPATETSGQSVTVDALFSFLTQQIDLLTASSSSASSPAVSSDMLSLSVEKSTSDISGHVPVEDFFDKSSTKTNNPTSRCLEKLSCKRKPSLASSPVRSRISKFSKPSCNDSLTTSISGNDVKFETFTNFYSPESEQNTQPGLSFQTTEDLSFPFSEICSNGSLLESEDQYSIDESRRMLSSALYPDDFISSFQLQLQQGSPVMDVLCSSPWNAGESEAMDMHPAMEIKCEITALPDKSDKSDGDKNPSQEREQQQQQQQPEVGEKRAKVLEAILKASQPLNANQGSDIIYEHLMNPPQLSVDSEVTSKTSSTEPPLLLPNCKESNDGSIRNNGTNLLHKLLKGQINEADIMRRCEESKRTSKEKTK